MGRNNIYINKNKIYNSTKFISNVKFQKRRFSSTNKVRTPEHADTIVRIAQGGPLPEGSESLIIHSTNQVITHVQHTLHSTPEVAICIVVSVLGIIFVQSATPYIYEGLNAIKQYYQNGIPNFDNMLPEEIEKCQITTKELIYNIKLYLQRAEQIENYLYKIVENDIYFSIDFWKINKEERMYIHNINQILSDFKKDYITWIQEKPGIDYLSWTGQLDTYISLNSKIELAKNCYALGLEEFMSAYMMFIHSGWETGAF